MQDIIVFMQQHWLLSLALIIVLILLLILELFRQQGGKNRLTPARATDLINHENAVVVDLRSSDAFASGHILNAISLPLKELEEKYKKIEKFKSQPIVLVCASSAESQRAVLFLEKNGYKVNLLNRGITAWRDANLPLIKG